MDAPCVHAVARIWRGTASPRVLISTAVVARLAIIFAIIVIDGVYSHTVNVRPEGQDECWLHGHTIICTAIVVVFLHRGKGSLERQRKR